MSLTLNKSKACSVEGIPSSYSILGGFTYVRGTVMVVVGRLELTLETLMSWWLWAWLLTLNPLAQ